MKLNINFSSRFFALYVALLSCPSQAADSVFAVQDLQLPIAVSHPVISANLLTNEGNELLVMGVNELQQRSLLILGFDKKTQQYQPQDIIVLPPALFAFDIGDDKSTLQRLYFLSKDQLWHYRPATADQPSAIVPQTAIRSMYLADNADFIQQRDFAQDINYDGKDDFIIADFEQLNLWLSNNAGSLTHQQLAISTHLRVEDERISFNEVKLYFADMNNDSLKDIVTVDDGQLQVFQQDNDGQFTVTPQPITIHPSISGINWWDKIEADGQNPDQSNLQHRVVEDIRDFNGDKIADMMVRFTQSSGVLDKTNDYELYLGQIKDQQLQFNLQADSQIQSDETLSGLQIVDIEEDGKLEVMLSAFDLGLTQIISALLAGSIDQEMLLFSLNEQHHFNPKPLSVQDVEITFSLSRGRSGEPMVKIADVNADGYKDILLSSGDDKIEIIYATPQGKRAFARKSVKFSVALPSNAKEITDADINNDGKTDLILHYGRLDAEALLKHITILTAR
ncbi:VCBS repeat-containing protein [Alteromonadaceae bacterium BrNp21-10]|nr:VCBS repeat-containing protein [Alteromonadaceae bacterium BrNp21-10]